MVQEPCTKFYGVLIGFHEIIKLKSFKFSVSDIIPRKYKTCHPWFSLDFLLVFMEKTPPTIKFYSIFHHLSRNREAAKFWIIKLYLNVNDVIHANEQTKYANCSLHKNFWNFLLMSFCFMIKRNYFKQKLLLWHLVPFKFLEKLIEAKLLKMCYLEYMFRNFLFRRKVMFHSQDI